MAGLIEFERNNRRDNLRFALDAPVGTRNNGHMRDYFEVGEVVTTPQVIPAFHDQSKRQMILPPPET